MKHFLCTFSFLIFAATSFHTSTAVAVSSGEEALVVLDTDNTAAAESEDIEVQIDPEQTPDESITWTRERFAQLAQQEMGTTPAKDRVEDFIGPRDPQVLEKVLQLSDKELNDFMNRKQAFLQRFQKILQWMHRPPAKINATLAELNARLYDSYRVVAGSNTKGSVFSVSINGGLAFPSQKFLELLRLQSLGKFIPAGKGFYYLMALGIGIAHRVDASGKGHLTFELFIDAEKLKSTYTAIVEISTAVNFGANLEHRDDNVTHRQGVANYGGASGVIRQGESQFGWTGSVGMGAPPMIGAFLVYRTDTTRLYIARLDNGKLTWPALNLIREKVRSLWRGRAPSCRAVFS